MRLQEFEKEVNYILRNIPGEYKRILEKEEIRVLCREKVPPEIAAEHRGMVIFGMFIGVSKKDKRVFSIQHEPTRIEIYKESFEEVYGDFLTEEMKGHIYRTVIHEIAHYFGFGEDEIRNLLGG